MDNEKMRTLIFFTMLLILTGCIADQKPKVYTNRVRFYKAKKQKVLYKAKPVDENCKINFPEPIIAEIRLNTYRLYKLNEHNKTDIAATTNEIKKVQKAIADLKTAISEIDKQHKQIKELKKRLEDINTRI